MSLNALTMRRSSIARGRGQGQGLARRWDRGIGGTFVGRRVRMLRDGPLRVNHPSPFKIAKSFSRAKDVIWNRDLFADSMAAAGLARAESGTKLYVSNLDYGVSNEDIKELFSEIGELKRSTTHYDRNGCPSGSAEVVYSRRSDAIAALKRYNNVQLDGKPMKIEIIGNNLGLAVAPRVNVVRGANGRGKRTVVMTPGFGHGAPGSFKQLPSGGRGRGRGASRGLNLRSRGRTGSRGRGRGRGRGGRQQQVVKTAEDLDAELEKYHAEAMSTSS